MAYDASKDKKVAEYDCTPDDESGGEQNHVYVQVYRYDGGAPKVQLHRMMGERHVKLGRLTLEEADSLISVLEQLAVDAQNGKFE